MAQSFETAADLPLAHEIAARVETFVREQVIPFERDPRNGPHGPSDDLVIELRAPARRRVQAGADPSGACTAVALHAVDGPRDPRAGNCDSLCLQAAGLWQAADRP